MSKNQKIESPSEKKSGHKPEIAPITEPLSEFAVALKSLSGMFGVNGDVDIQAMKLNDGHFQRIQRQMTASQLGKTQGNRGLQRIMTAVIRGPVLANGRTTSQERSLEGANREAGLTVKSPSVMLQVQREPVPAKTKADPIPQTGWKGAPRGTENEHASKVVKTNIWRIPLSNLEVGLRDKAPTEAAYEDANNEAIALVPDSIVHPKQEKDKNKNVEVLLHLHGYGVGYRRRKTQLTTTPNDPEPKNPKHTRVPGGEEETVRDISLDRFAEQLEASGRDVIGILPQGDLQSQFGSEVANKVDDYIKTVFKALKNVKISPEGIQLPEGIQPGGVVLTGHSGGGDRIYSMMVNGKEPTNLREVVLFDAIHRNKEKGVEPIAENIKNWLEVRIKKDLKGMRAATLTDTDQADWLRNNGFRFRAYHSNSSFYTENYKALRRKLEVVFKSDKDITTLGSAALMALRENYHLHETWATGVDLHEQLLGKSNGITKALNALPGSASSISTPAAAGTKQPVQPKRTGTISPWTAGQRESHLSRKLQWTISDTPYPVTKASPPKAAEGKKPAEPGRSQINESPRDFTAEILRRAGKDPADWFSNFENFNFLGRELTTPIHSELANHLKIVQAKFVQSFIDQSDDNRKKYTGKEKDPATISAAGDALGLSTLGGDQSGSRHAPSGTAAISMHLFGLAVDLNYTANPYIGQHAKNPTMIRIFEEAGLLINGKAMAYRHGMSYDQLAEMDKTLETYFSYLDKPDQLKTQLSATTVSPWKGMDVKTATSKVQADLNSLAPMWERAKSAQTDVIRRGGFMDFKKEFVEGIGLDWGGSTYGDMMHFDMRNTGIGKKIHDKIEEYKQEKAREAERKYQAEHPPTLPIQRQQPASAPTPSATDPQAALQSVDSDLIIPKTEGFKDGERREQFGREQGNHQSHVTLPSHHPDLAQLQKKAGEAGNAPASDAGAKEDSSTDAEIDALNLESNVKEQAKALKKKHSEIVFTSGRRDWTEQAEAMARNIVESANRKWIEATYAKSGARAKLQKWVDDHADAKTEADLAKGLKETLDGMSTKEQGMISKHPTGEAFDVQPQKTDADQIKKDMAALSGATKFLEKEGGLDRWHVQFKKDEQTASATKRPTTVAEALQILKASERDEALQGPPTDPVLAAITLLESTGKYAVDYGTYKVSFKRASGGKVKIQTIEDFILFVEAVEQTYPGAKPSEIVSEIRQMWFGSDTWRAMLASEGIKISGKDEDIESEPNPIAKMFDMKDLAPSGGARKLIETPLGRVDIAHVMTGIDAALSGSPTDSGLIRDTLRAANKGDPRDFTTMTGDLAQAYAFYILARWENGNPSASLKQFVALEASDEELLGDIHGYIAYQVWKDVPGKVDPSGNKLKVSHIIRTLYLVNKQEAGIKDRGYQAYLEKVSGQKGDQLRAFIVERSLKFAPLQYAKEATKDWGWKKKGWKFIKSGGTASEASVLLEKMHEFNNHHRKNESETSEENKLGGLVDKFLKMLSQNMP